MVHKAELLEVIQHGYNEVMHFAALVPAGERTVQGQADAWAAKDTLAHIAEWQLQSAAEMEGTKRTDPDVSETKGDDDANLIVFNRYRTASWDEIMALLESGHRKLLGLAERFSEDDLNEPARFEWTEGRPLWRRFISDVYMHVMAHLNPEFVRRGDRQHALQSLDDQERLLVNMDPSDDWQGVTQYNMACLWALLGETQRALSLLEPSLRLAPRLIEWSRQDSDLSSLHGTPEFEGVLSRVTPATPSV